MIDDVDDVIIVDNVASEDGYDDGDIEAMAWLSRISVRD